jgi:putative Holliday junction resolvase
MHTGRRRGKTVLGFDFGLKRIGVAVGQHITATSSALSTIPNREDQPDWITISRLVQAWNPGALVVGMPSGADGTETPLTFAVRRFARELGIRFRLPVHFMDERLSSHEARARIARRPNARKRHAADSMAAKIILQDWLEQEDTTG